MEELPEALKTLKNAEDSWPFLAPVNWKGLGLDDYPELIKKPMDLRTVTKNLKNGVYSNSAAFWADVDQIWTNCFIYNDESSNVYQMAVRMRKLSLKLRGIAPEQPPDEIRKFSKRFCRLTPKDAALVIRFIGQTRPECLSPFVKRNGGRQFEFDVGVLYNDYPEDFQKAYVLVKLLKLSGEN